VDRRSPLPPRTVSPDLTRRPEIVAIFGVFAIMSGLLGPACHGEKSDREPALELLGRISAIDVHAPFADRAARLRELLGLRLADPRLLRVRDECATAHGGLLSAEREQAAVRERIDRADREPVAAPELASLQSALARAAESLRDAHSALPDCERSTRELTAETR
jgi:hypothetical protein